mmetsp:Transcript_25214/g.84498  ORF Transcript_25214/g.84498 Transcript_25214/m.84498 type:complete len:277 (-) Transcript_25214:262-1092(-)
MSIAPRSALRAPGGPTATSVNLTSVREDASRAIFILMQASSRLRGKLSLRLLKLPQHARPATSCATLALAPPNLFLVVHLLPPSEATPHPGTAHAPSSSARSSSAADALAAAVRTPLWKNSAESFRARSLYAACSDLGSRSQRAAQARASPAGPSMSRVPACGCCSKLNSRKPENRSETACSALRAALSVAGAVRVARKRGCSRPSTASTRSRTTDSMMSPSERPPVRLAARSATMSISAPRARRREPMWASSSPPRYACTLRRLSKRFSVSGQIQ